MAYFLHCELNDIERVWGQAKAYCRAHTNFTSMKFGQIIKPALDSLSVDLILKYARKVRDYEKAYRSVHQAVKSIEAAVKSYKSHREFLMTLLIKFLFLLF